MMLIDVIYIDLTFIAFMVISIWTNVGDLKRKGNIKG